MPLFVTIYWIDIWSSLSSVVGSKNSTIPLLIPATKYPLSYGPYPKVSISTWHSLFEFSTLNTIVLFYIKSVFIMCGFDSLHLTWNLPAMNTFKDESRQFTNYDFTFGIWITVIDWRELLLLPSILGSPLFGSPLRSFDSIVLTIARSNFYITTIFLPLVWIR